MAVGRIIIVLIATTITACLHEMLMLCPFHSEGCFLRRSRITLFQNRTASMCGKSKQPRAGSLACCSLLSPVLTIVQPFGLGYLDRYRHRQRRPTTLSLWLGLGSPHGH